MDNITIYYPESDFGGFTDIDGTVAFYFRVNSFIHSSSVVLDVGCGSGSSIEELIPVKQKLRIFKGKCKKIIGIDVDENASKNPFCDEFRLIKGDCWPLKNHSVDICICDNVLEHVDDLKIFFSECQRVIKTGGYLFIRTPNALSYIGLFSKMIPNRFHSFVASKVQKERKKESVFPAYYRCNTIRKIRNMLNKYGFYSCVYGYEAEPSYLSFSRLFYFLGIIHQRFAPKVLKAAIFAYGRKI
ncbi:MAG: methyltransferase domain-containing protein [Candidatus Margulisiibacteriota bacterium]